MTKTQISGGKMEKYEYPDEWFFDDAMYSNDPPLPENTDEYWEYLLEQADQIL